MKARRDTLPKATWRGLLGCWRGFDSRLGRMDNKRFHILFIALDYMEGTFGFIEHIYILQSCFSHRISLYIFCVLNTVIESCKKAL